jgi:hypothetical protein
MAITCIVAIPSYYRSSSYVFVPPEKHPTTTARYIILTPASSEILTTRNTTILKDVRAWGWNVYSTKRSLPNMEKWFTKYEKLAKKNNWDDDIWKIWQREHGLKIAENDSQRKRDEIASKDKIGSVVYSVKRVGGCFGKNNMSIDYDERKLRREEEAKEEERRWKLADNQLKERSAVPVPDPFADSEEVVDDEENSGELKDDSGMEAKTTVGEGTEAFDPAVLSRHSWLSRG